MEVTDGNNRRLHSVPEALTGSTASTYYYVEVQVVPWVLADVKGTNRRTGIMVDEALYWNDVLLTAALDDSNKPKAQQEQGGPTRTSRAAAIVHAARCIAACPLAVARPATPPSSAAIRSSNTATVGFEIRE